MNKENINFALLGCSRISKQHIAAIKELANRCTLLDVCDLNIEALENTKSLIHVNCYSDYDEMLKNTKADCIIITTPNGLHHQHALKALRAGFHVITEKPMAINVEHAEEMIKVSKENNKHLFVVKQVRFSNCVQMIKNALEDKRFGKIYMVNLNLFWTRPQEFYDIADWRGSLNMDGGTLFNQGSHYIDLIDWLFGPVKEVGAMNATLARSIEAEDSSVINLKLKGGALASIAITILTYPSNLECSITIIGEKGTVKLGGPSLNKFDKWEFSEMSAEDNKIDTSHIYPSGFPHTPYYSDVLDVLQSGKKPETDGHEGIKSLKIISAALESSKTRKNIKI